MIAGKLTRDKADGTENDFVNNFKISLFTAEMQQTEILLLVS